ncbi:uncharacterized protein LOC114742166 [Neltuma alba]|uniref:uncharacterized protein LOC114742166 n=1 Tax=Neltuma alba TaxID=207710 RepID=UPI0010A5017D|nr:uncharacterized protein LOC114742166 [Prosopis alba]XP_028786265.1 uncharacterized protein LOC114742166 [Prosopis alba]
MRLGSAEAGLSKTNAVVASRMPQLFSQSCVQIRRGQWETMVLRLFDIRDGGIRFSVPFNSRYESSVSYSLILRMPGRQYHITPFMIPQLMARQNLLPASASGGKTKTLLTGCPYSCANSCLYCAALYCLDRCTSENEPEKT